MATVVQVTVTMIPPGAGTKRSITISVDPDPVDLTNQPDQADIDWVLTNSPGWAFLTQGIDVKWHWGKFKDRGVSPDKQKHGWRRKQRDNDPYRYTISVENLTDPNNPVTLTWDPFIFNR